MCEMRPGLKKFVLWRERHIYSTFNVVGILNKECSFIELEGEVMKFKTILFFVMLSTSIYVCGKAFAAGGPATLGSGSCQTAMPNPASVH